ncbi:MAG: F0F1 ATP synthase subunit B' [Pseudomonadota bacterium]
MATDSHGDAASGSGGLPQLDFSTWPSQIFWLVISLVILYQLMTKIALPRISSVLEERADAIADDLDRAEEFKRKAEEASLAYDRALAEARTEAQAIAAKTRAEIQKEIDAEMAKADEEIAARAAESERRIKEVRDDALASVGQVAEETAAAVVEAVLPDAMDADAVKAAVQAELG